MQQYKVGVDIGGTKTAIGLVNDSGEIVNEIIIPTKGIEGPEKVVSRIVHTIEKITANLEFEGVGIGVPGTIDSNNGIIMYWAIFDWKRVPLGEMVSKALNTKVTVVNDANAAAWGEYKIGAGKNATNMIYITHSTSVGGGIILNKKLFLGSSKLAGEVGHMIVQPDGSLCPCGNKGCLAEYASGTAIEQLAKKIITGDKSMSTVLNEQNDEINSKLVIEAAISGDKIANEIIDHAAKYTAITLVNLIHLLNPDVIVLGGGVMKDHEFFFNKIVNETNSAVIPSYKDSYKVRKSKIFENAALIGATYLINEFNN